MKDDKKDIGDNEVHLLKNIKPNLIHILWYLIAVLTSIKFRVLYDFILIIIIFILIIFIIYYWISAHMFCDFTTSYTLLYSLHTCYLNLKTSSSSSQYWEIDLYLYISVLHLHCLFTALIHEVFYFIEVLPNRLNVETVILYLIFPFLLFLIIYAQRNNYS